MAWLRRMTMDIELCIYPTNCVSIMYILIQQMQVIGFMEHSWIRRVTRQMQISISTASDEWWESMLVMKIQWYVTDGFGFQYVELSEMAAEPVSSLQFLSSPTRRFSGISLSKIQLRFLPPHLPQHTQIRVHGRPRLRHTDMLLQTHEVYILTFKPTLTQKDAQSQRWLCWSKDSSTINPLYVPWP